MACTSCFCWADARRVTAIIGLFSALTSAIQILVTASVFTGGSVLYGAISFTPSSLTNTVYELYIALSVLDFLVIVFSLVLLCGNERPDEVRARCFVLPWVIFMCFYVAYESGINIFYFYNSFNQGFPFTYPVANPLYNGGYSGFQIVPLVYWLIKDILIIYSVGFLISRLHSPLPASKVPTLIPAKIEVAAVPRIVNIYPAEQNQSTFSYFPPAPKFDQYRNGAYLEEGMGIRDGPQYQAVPMRRPWYNYANALVPNVTRYGRNPY